MWGQASPRTHYSSLPTACCLTSRLPILQDFANNFRDSFTKLGGKIVDEESYHDGDNDYSAQLTSIRGANPQFIYIPGYYTEVVTIAQQARKLGITCPLIGGDGWVSDKLKDAGHALDGCYFSDHYAKEDTRPEVSRISAQAVPMPNLPTTPTAWPRSLVMMPRICSSTPSSAQKASRAKTSLPQ